MGVGWDAVRGNYEANRTAAGQKEMYVLFLVHSRTFVLIVFTVMSWPLLAVESAAEVPHPPARRTHEPGHQLRRTQGRDLAGLSHFVNDILLPHESVQHVKTSIVLSVLKDFGGIPIQKPAKA